MATVNVGPGQPLHMVKDALTCGRYPEINDDGKTWQQNCVVMMMEYNNVYNGNLNVIVSLSKVVIAIINIPGMLAMDTEHNESTQTIV